MFNANKQETRHNIHDNQKLYHVENVNQIFFEDMARSRNFENGVPMERLDAYHYSTLNSQEEAMTLYSQTLTTISKVGLEVSLERQAGGLLKGVALQSEDFRDKIKSAATRERLASAQYDNVEMSLHRSEHHYAKTRRRAITSSGKKMADVEKAAKKLKTKLPNLSQKDRIKGFKDLYKDINKASKLYAEGLSRNKAEEQRLKDQADFIYLQRMLAIYNQEMTNSYNDLAVRSELQGEIDVLQAQLESLSARLSLFDGNTANRVRGEYVEHIARMNEDVVSGYRSTEGPISAENLRSTDYPTESVQMEEQEERLKSIQQEASKAKISEEEQNRINRAKEIADSHMSVYSASKKIIKNLDDDSDDEGRDSFYDEDEDYMQVYLEKDINSGKIDSKYRNIFRELNIRQGDLEGEYKSGVILLARYGLDRQVDKETGQVSYGKDAQYIDTFLALYVTVLQFHNPNVENGSFNLANFLDEVQSRAEAMEILRNIDTESELLESTFSNFSTLFVALGYPSLAALKEEIKAAKG